MCAFEMTVSTFGDKISADKLSEGVSAGLEWLKSKP